MNILVIDHTFLEPEYQKNMIALSKFANVLCVLPKTGVTGLRYQNFHSNPEYKHLFMPIKPVYFTRSQYILLSADLGMNKLKPDIINLAYNPWSPIFLQTVLYKNLFCKHALIVCSIKKNTYVEKKGIFKFLKKWLTPITSSWVDFLLAESQLVADLWIDKLHFPKEKIAVATHLGVDVNIFSPDGHAPQHKTSTSPTIIGYCGRFDVDKGILELFEAIRLIEEKSPNSVILRILGKISDRGPVDNRIAATLAEKPDWLQVFPPVPNKDIPAFLRNLDIFVLPSRRLPDHQEHDAHILKEALAVGVPCIGTKCGVIPDILTKDIGLLVEPENPRALADAILELIDNKVLRGKLASEGRKATVQKYSVESVTINKVAIFKKLISKLDGH